MNITVLGATGLLGRKIYDRLHRNGHEVLPASRATGVDAYSGQGLAAALTGADVVVDALDVKTMSRRRATDFFTTCAKNITATAAEVGVGRLVCVSIYGADDPDAGRAYGYYAAKAAQERIYASAQVPATVVLSTQWFELIEDVVRRASLGPVTLLPAMRMAPLSADAAAAAVADVAMNPHSGPTVVVRGAEEADTLDLARVILQERGSIAGRRPRVLRQLPYLGRAIAGGALLPQEADTVVPGGIRDWVRAAH